jgi:hypothetical protein
MADCLARLTARDAGNHDRLGGFSVPLSRVRAINGQLPAVVQRLMESLPGLQTAYAKASLA